MANPSKFQFMNTLDNNVILTHRGVTIEQYNYVKLLGVNINKKLDFKFLVNEDIRKCARQLNALGRQSRVLNVLAKKKVFNAFIRANLNYCPLVWINRNKTDLDRLEKVQERAVWLIFNDKMSTYIDLLRKAEVPSVLIRWQQVLAIEVYKALQGLSALCIQNLFNEKKLPYNLRASKIIIQLKCNTTTIGLNSLTYQGAKLWNSLPEHIKTVESVNKFQILIEKHIV